MPSSPSSSIPNRAYTLRVLRAISGQQPVLMLTGCEDGYGTRGTLGGELVQPAIARYLMEAGFITENGKTELGARKLVLTADGVRYRERGVAWWASLSIFEKLKVTVLG